MNRGLFYSFSSFLFLILFFCFLFIPIFISYPELINSNSSLDSSLEYIWPIPGYTKITSPFGKRISPTAGASTFHKGIDIGAPEGTSLYAVCDGEITFASFLGGGGYTITLSSNNVKITYCHVSADFLVSVGDQIEKGELIAKVGPKNVYGVPNNPYKDKDGNPTNGSTTGCHLHIGIRVNDKYVDPLNFLIKP